MSADGLIQSSTINTGEGDDSVSMFSIDGNSTIDFGVGYDMLIIEDDVILDFNNLSLEGNSYNQINNLEVIDMQNGSGTNDLQNLDLSDVLHMTDDDNILRILGDSGDEIGLNVDGDDALWTKSDTQVTEDGEELGIWTSTDNSATLYIDNDISITDF